MPTTIYKRLNDREFIYSRNDLRKIAYWVHENYIKENDGNDPDKIEQVEEDKTFSVFNYPDEWIEIIDNITDWYFKKKRRTGEQHIRREQRAKEAKLAREKNPDAVQDRDQKDKHGNKRYPNDKNRGNFSKKPGQKFGNSQQQGGYKKPSGSRQKPNGQPGNQPKSGYSKQNTGSAGNNTGRPYKSNNNNNFKTRNNWQDRNNHGQNRGFTPRPPRDNDAPQERRTYSGYDSDERGNDAPMGNYANKYRNSAPRTSYYDNPNERRFSQKVELDTPEGNSPDAPKKRKRIAKALFVAAPEPQKNENRENDNATE